MPKKVIRLMSITLTIQREINFETPADVDEDALGELENNEAGAWVAELERLGWNVSLESMEPSKALRRKKR